MGKNFIILNTYMHSIYIICFHVNFRLSPVWFGLENV